MCVVGFIRGRWVSRRVHSVYETRCRWVHPESSGSLGCALGVVEFTGVRPGSSLIHPWSLGSLEFALGILGFNQSR